MTPSDIDKLTPAEINARIAVRCKLDDRWTLKKRGYYYRPNAGGYTACIADAWIITESEADKHVYPHDEPVTKHRAPVLPFHSSLDACAQFEATLTDEQYYEYRTALRGIVKVSHRAYLSATAPQRCRAFLAVTEP